MAIISFIQSTYQYEFADLPPKVGFDREDIDTARNGATAVAQQ